MGCPSPRTACTLQVPARDGEEMQAGAPSRPCKRERAVPEVQRGSQLAVCGVSGISVRCLRGHWSPCLLPVALGRRWQPPPVSGCHLVSLGRRARQAVTPRIGSPGSRHLQGPAGRHPKTAWVLGHPSLGDGLHPTTYAPRGQHGSRPQRRTMDIAQVMQRQRSSKRCLGLLRGSRGSQGLETQQPHRRHGAAPAEGGSVKEQGEHPP